jgi:serine/threonine protein kinase
MMTIENDEVLHNFVKNQERQPQPRHVRSHDGREIYLSHVDLGPIQDSMTIPKLSDFNIAYPGSENDGPRVWPIQSHRYRAPEVILGCPWSYSVDIWNLGLLVSHMS